MKDIKKTFKEKSTGQQSSEIEKYWLHQLSDEPVKSVFPYDKTRKGAAGFIPGTFIFKFSHELYAQLMKLSSDSLPRLQMLLTAGLAALLYKYTQTRDIILGTSIYKQEIEAEFINTILPLRQPVSGRMKFKELVMMVRETITRANENQNYPVEKLLQKLKIPYSKNDDFPLFDVAVLLENIQDKAYIEHINPSMAFYFRRTGETAACRLEYNTLLYEKETIERIAAHTRNIMHRLMFNADREIREIDILSEEEKQRLLVEFNDTGVPYPKDMTMSALFEEQAEKTPDNTAVICGEKQVTYQELRQIVNGLCPRLRDKGVKAETIVGIMAERSLELIVAILAVQKAGAAYLPLDPELPTARIGFILKDSRACLLLAHQQFLEKQGPALRHFAPGRIIPLDKTWKMESPPGPGAETKEMKALEPLAGPGSMAYVIYTSGTTGKPKGVIISHQAILNYTWWAAQRYAGEEAVNFPFYTSISFDLTITSIFVPLVTGNNVVVYPAGEKAAIIEEILRRDHVDAVKLTPSHLTVIRQSTAAGKSSHIKRFIVGGEALETGLAADIERNFNGRIEIYNEYGPTEAAVGCMIYKFSAQDDTVRTVPIGRPIHNTAIYILDDDLRPVPRSAAGQLYIRGHGVARGYLNRPELTAEKFIMLDLKAKIKLEVGAGEEPREQIPGKHRSNRSYKSYIIYRTGDLARWLPGGDIQFLARVDQQLKIRGYRIEPGEIECCLSGYPTIKEAVIVLDKDNTGERQLFCYVVPTVGFILNNRESLQELQTKLKRHLKENLPAYMIPPFITFLKEIPLTPNGKIDRKKLLEFSPTFSTAANPPRDEIEKQLVEIWSENLGIKKDQIGIDSDYFDLGGHSLKGTILIANIHKKFNVEVSLGELFKAPRIRELAELIRGLEENRFSSIEPVEKKQDYPLSSVQKRMYILQQMNLENTAYNVLRAVVLRGRLDPGKLEDTFKRLVCRHESLRTSFEMMGEKPVQKVHDFEEVEFNIRYLEIPGNTSLVNVIGNSFIRPFDLAQAPLLRVGLIKERKEKHIMVVDMHHIITDALSMDLLVEEFFKLYASQILPSLKLQYKDYARWQTGEERAGVLDKQESYWLGRFNDEIPVLDIPVDFPRPAVQSYEGSLLRFQLEEEHHRALKEIGTGQEATLYMMLLTVYFLLLAKITGQEDIIVGTDVAGRTHTHLEGIIGMFVNTLALRQRLTGGETFLQLLGKVKQNTLQALQSQDYPFEDLVEKVSVNRDAGRNPLFDVMYSFIKHDTLEPEANPRPRRLAHDLEIVPYFDESLHNTTKFDLSFNAVEISGRLSLSIEYCTRLFKKETIRRYSSFIKQIVSTVVREPHRRVSEIEIISPEEKHRILFQFNNTAAPIPAETSYPGLFEEQVSRNPDKIAAIYQNQHITFRQLNRRALSIAGILKEKGLTRNQFVLLYMERSPRMLAAIMGVFKAGGAYVPLDTDYPLSRVAYILENSRAGIIITNKQSIDALQSADKTNSLLKTKTVLNPDQESPAARADSQGSFLPTQSHDLVYMIYTSGTTGQPKGVMIHQLGMINHLWAKVNDFSVSERDIVAQTASAAFDISVWQFLVGPLMGGTTCILDRETVLDPAALLQVVGQRKVTILELVPSLIAVLLETTAQIPAESKSLPHLRFMISTGEPLNHTLAKEWYRQYPDTTLANAYGPTEASDDITHHVVEKTSLENQTFIPIGKPISNMHVYILDKYLNLCPVGIKGEICTTGPGVGKGYWQDSEKTRASFIPNPLLELVGDSAFARLYRTGDIGYFNPDGSICCQGRLDHQVKIRGNRIELGEIQGRLAAHEDIKETVVVDRNRENGDKYLCAYLVSDRDCEPAVWREYLLEELPDYMVPAYFIRMDKIPLNISGKIDRQSLPEPREDREEKDEQPAPRDEIEKKLVEIWQQVLGGKRIGINDDFFMMGGDSIKTIQVVSRMSAAGYKLAMRDIFQYPLISQLASRVTRAGRVPGQRPVTGTVPLTPIQVDFFARNRINHHHYNLSTMLYSRERFEKDSVEIVFKKLQEHHDALRMTFQSEDGKIIQINHGLEYPVLLNQHDLQGEENPGETMRAEINKIQSGIDLEKGPLIRLGLFHLEDGDRLLIAAHHLVIDGVSWRILFEDMDTLFRQYKKRETLSLPPKTDSYKYWAEKLLEYANQDSFLKEKAYWGRFETGKLPGIEKDFEGSNYIKDTERQSFYLSQEDTGLMLTTVNDAFGTNVDDILLSALSLSINDIYGLRKLVVAIEGHGREEILEGIDINRTVGWFTSLYPVMLDISYAHDLARQIKEVKENLHQVPNKGIGYGILKYLTAPGNKKGFHFQTEPQIIFNYMGQFDNDIQSAAFALSRERVGNMQSPEAQRDYELEVSGIISGKQLLVTIDYSGKQYKADTIKKILNLFRDKLEQIISFCVEQEEREVTPSDFNYKGFSVEELDSLFD